MGGPQNRSGRCEEERNLAPTGDSNSDPSVVQPVARQLYLVLLSLLPTAVTSTLEAGKFNFWFGEVKVGDTISQPLFTHERNHVCVCVCVCVCARART
jgi:hypothetical protein